MKNAITKPKKNHNLQPSNRIKAITSIVLSAIIGVMAGLIILALSSSNAFAAPAPKPQDRPMRAGEVGVFHTIKDGVVCGTFSHWLEMREALIAGQKELITYHITKPDAGCVTTSEGVEVIVTESNDRWVKGSVKSGKGYLTFYTHLVFLKKKGV